MGYILDSGLGQWRLFNRAQPVEKILKSPSAKEETKKAIRTVIAAKQFANEELGLEATSSYREFVQLDGEYVTWVVVASDPLRLEAKKWRFPIVGEIPYIGFFSKDDAEKFARGIREKENLDVFVRGAPAFSSLGWFPDPLYSSMISESEREIVDLVVHESFHATVWVNSQAEFNERVANFIGLESSLHYLEKKYGSASPQIVEAHAEIGGERIFAAFIDQIVKEFKTEIEAFAVTDPSKAYQKKAEFYKNLESKFEEFFKRNAAGKNLKKIKPSFKNWNNANILNFKNYYYDFSPLSKLLKLCHSDIRRMIAVLKQQNKKKAFDKNPEEAIQSLLKLSVCEI